MKIDMMMRKIFKDDFVFGWANSLMWGWYPHPYIPFMTCIRHEVGSFMSMHQGQMSWDWLSHDLPIIRMCMASASHTTAENGCKISANIALQQKAMVGLILSMMRKVDEALMLSTAASLRQLNPQNQTQHHSVNAADFMALWPFISFFNRASSRGSKFLTSFRLKI
jgi:hypothetical protein